ncbi:E3 ubiquitin-protein ligase RNF26-like [Synchiropus splendidus]|uniref:E3 ubiquitin-protein ligase RNF26-like n=1 Tax=Synchiropus splendidus TaxID=270530 RepID=UPI00237EBC4E|nr:E3 ubiquitin-protein ligase RNF26-like [Synchiropus splendidus]
MLIVICIKYFGKSNKTIICIIIWNAVYVLSGGRSELVGLIGSVQYFTFARRVSCCPSVTSLEGVMESFKIVGHLCCHMLWRCRDALHRTLLSANCLLRQTWDGAWILLSLVLYLVNTVVNIALIAAQNSFYLMVGVWEGLSGPLHQLMEATVTLLMFFYSSVVGASVLLWTSCQLVLDFLGALGRVVFVVDMKGVLITAASTFLFLLFLSPRLSLLVRRLLYRPVSGLLRAARRVHASLVEPVLTYEVVHSRAVQEVRRTSVSPPAARCEPGPEDGDGRTDDRCSQPSVSAQDGELLSLLEEQEERKKCVICQDLSKTVLLLPCRHLCLCQPCAQILTQRRPIQQRCCPLCRQPITQTMDVFL